MSVIEYLKAKRYATYLLALVVISCSDTEKKVKDDCDKILELHSKDILIQSIHDIRFRLRHPSSNAGDIARYNEILFTLWISDLDRFKKIYPSLPLFREDQGEMLHSLLTSNDPMNFNRFGNVTIKSDDDHVAIMTDFDKSYELRLLLVENFNDSKRVFYSYEEEASRYAKEIAKTMNK